MLEISASQKSLPTTFLTKTLMRITSLQSFMTKCSCNIFIFTHYRYVKIQIRRREELEELEKDGIVSAHGHHCTLYKALWHPESTIYILAMVLINSGYSIIDEKSMTWVERENYFLSFSFQNARQPDLLPGRG